MSDIGIFEGYTGGSIGGLDDELGEALDTTEKQSAKSIINETLTRYGLESLESFVYNLVFNENIVSESILVGRIRGTDEYDARFDGNRARREAGLNALSEAEYIAVENQYRSLFRNSGLPAGFYTDKETTDMLISNDVSIAEVSERVNQGYEAVANADPEVILEMKRLYNIDDGGLAAYFLDPERATPALISQARSAGIAGEAIQEGFELQLSTAEELSRQGIDSRQAQQGFQTMADLAEVFQTTTQEAQAGEQAFGQEEQVAAVFGTSGAAQQRLRQRARRRQAQFEQGGRFAGQGSELTGLQ
ncbi:MAG: hypothetical protein ACYTEW_13580 [Planctomycetota bacterium]|jgi:hypothetical protein